MAQNLYLTALEDLWDLVKEEAGTTVERELKCTFQLFLDPTEGEDYPFNRDDAVSVKCTKFKEAMSTALPDCSTEGNHVLTDMFEHSDSPLHLAVRDVFTTLRTWISEFEDSDSD
jgi:hypothetical protein